MSEAPGVFSTALAGEFRARLGELKAALLRTVAVTDAELAALEVPETGGPPEHATSVSTASLLSRLEGQEKHELDEISDALGRLEAGAYGLCQRCARPIPLARLRAMPAARHCITCQVGQEARP